MFVVIVIEIAVSRTQTVHESIEHVIGPQNIIEFVHACLPAVY